MCATFGGMAKGWLTPKWIPKLIRRHGFTPDLYVCDRTQRLGVTRVDNDPTVRPDVLADFTALPFADQSYDTVFFDPPYPPAVPNVPYKKGVRECARVARRVLITHMDRVTSCPPGFAFHHVMLTTHGFDAVTRATCFYVREGS